MAMANRQLCGRDDRRISRAIPIHQRRGGTRRKEARRDERGRSIRARELATVDPLSAAARIVALRLQDAAPLDIPHLEACDVKPKGLRPESRQGVERQTTVLELLANACTRGSVSPSVPRGNGTLVQL